MYSRNNKQQVHITRTRRAFGFLLLPEQWPCLDRRYINRADARQSFRTCTSFFRQHQFQGIENVTDITMPTQLTHERRYRPSICETQLHRRTDAFDSHCTIFAQPRKIKCTSLACVEKHSAFFFLSKRNESKPQSRSFTTTS